MSKFKKDSVSRTQSTALRKRRRGVTRLGKGWQKYFEEFQNALAPQALIIRDVDGDGNCLFRAVADQIGGNEDNHRHYRKIALRHIRENSKLYSNFLLEDETIDEYVKEMEEDGTWGGHFELAALSGALGCNFYVHQLGEDPVLIGGLTEVSKAKSRTYHLAYSGGHYCSIRKIGDQGSSTVKQINMFTKLKEEEQKLSEDEQKLVEKKSEITSTDVVAAQKKADANKIHCDEESKDVEPQVIAQDASQTTSQASTRGIQNDEMREKATTNSKLRVRAQGKVINDNAKCPCGSKSKYKKCCKKFADNF